MQGRNKQQFVAAAFSLAFVAGPAAAQREASALGAVSALPIASSAVSLVRDAGASWLVRSAQASGRGSVYGLEHASDGARTSVEIGAGRLLLTGTVLSVRAIGTGVVLTAAGEAIAFMPNPLGRALLQNAATA